MTLEELALRRAALLKKINNLPSMAVSDIAYKAIMHKGMKAELATIENSIAHHERLIQTAHCNEQVTTIIYKDSLANKFSCTYPNLSSQAEIQLVINRDTKKYNLQLVDIQQVISGQLKNL